MVVASSLELRCVNELRSNVIWKGIRVTQVLVLKEELDRANQVVIIVLK